MCSLWNVLAYQYVYNFDKTLEGTASFSTISGLLSHCYALIDH